MQSISILAVLAFTLSYTLGFHVKSDLQWRSWKENYNKQYSDVDEHVRYEIFYPISRD